MVIKNWRVSDILPGDYVEARIHNKEGDRNLDGAVLAGVVKDVELADDFVCLQSGWCIHGKDELLVHKTVEELAES